MAVVISDARRFVLTVVIVGIVLPTLMFWTRLPEPIATNWSSGGHANGSMPKWLWLVIALVWTEADLEVGTSVAVVVVAGF